MYFFFFKQKTAYEMRISDWSSDVCSSDLDHSGEHRDAGGRAHFRAGAVREHQRNGAGDERDRGHHDRAQAQAAGFERRFHDALALQFELARELHDQDRVRSEEHTSELQSLMRISYAVFCLHKNKLK